MCFSASASFVASGGLVALGGASFVSAKKEDKILAAVPIMFGVQQFFEGIQWLYLNNNSISLVAGYAFLFFSFIVWPIYVPSFIYILDKKERKILKMFIVLGVGLALYSLGMPLTQSLSIQKINLCINYAFNYHFQNFVTLVYVVTIFGPFFVSSKKIFNWFGALFVFFAFYSWYFYKVNFVSVWCFYAAIVSSTFFVYIKMKNNSKNKCSYKNND